MSRTLGTKLAMDALNMAIAHRGPPVTLHSDQGSTYATGSYREIVSRYGIRQSMSRKGDCSGNAGPQSTSQCQGTLANPSTSQTGPVAWRARQTSNAVQVPQALVDRKYRLLFSSSPHRCKPGPKGPSAQLIAAIVDMKQRNPRFGYMRIAQQISHAFGVEIDKDVVCRVLARHYRPDDSGAPGSSWLALIAHAKDSL